MNLRFLISILSSLLLFNVVNSKENICGGIRPLEVDNIGEYCDSNIGSDCPFGQIACGVDRNSIFCSPNCSITAKTILSANNRLPTCQNGGIFDLSKRICICTSAFEGKWCEVPNLCQGIDCSVHGKCEDGKCVCDTAFMGSRCEIKKDCNAPHLRWTGNQCECNVGWAGENCLMCLNTSICVPNQDLSTFSLLYIDDQDFLESLLKFEYKNIQAFRPTPKKYQCQCNPVMDVSSPSSPSNPYFSMIEHFSESKKNQKTFQLLNHNTIKHSYNENNFIHSFLIQFFKYQNEKLTDKSSFISKNNNNNLKTNTNQKIFIFFVIVIIFLIISISLFVVFEYLKKIN